MSMSCDLLNFDLGDKVKDSGKSHILDILPSHFFTCRVPKKNWRTFFFRGAKRLADTGELGQEAPFIWHTPKITCIFLKVP